MRKFWIYGLITVVCVVNLSIFGYFFPYLTASFFDSFLYDMQAVFLNPLIIVTIILLAVLVFRKVKKKRSHIVLKILPIITGLSSIICGLMYSSNENLFYRDGFGITFTRDEGLGVVNRWGGIILEPAFDYIAVANYKPTNEQVLIGINCEESGCESDFDDCPWYDKYMVYGDPVYISFFDMQGNQIKYVKAKYKSSGSFEEYFGDEFSKPRGLGGNFHRYNSNDESREDFDIDELTFRITDSSESDYSSSKREESGSKSYDDVDDYVTEKEKRSPQPVQVWCQCVNCFGSGNCPYCMGQGVVLNTFNGQYEDCNVCRDGRCAMCAGSGGHYETEYR